MSDKDIEMTFLRSRIDITKSDTKYEMNHSETNCIRELEKRNLD